MTLFRFSNQFLAFAVCLLVIMVSCSTGIESTKTIKMSKAEKKETMPSDEQIFADSFSSQYLKDWQKGKKFLATDDKASLLLESEYGNSDGLKGAVLFYDGVETRKTAGTGEICMIRFINPKTGGRLLYNSKKTTEGAMNEISGLDLPLLIDLDLVALVKSQLVGKKLWTRTFFWYDSIGNNLKGKKFVPVTIKNVDEGNMYFPVKIEFNDESGSHAYLYMNVKSGTGIGAESRTFPSLFSLSDPRMKYAAVSDEVWENIRKGEVALGMTKEECKLSLGNPTDVDTGHDWNNTLDIWRYSDGTFLNFQDGLLVNFRH